MKIQEIIDLPELSHDKVERKHLVFTDAQLAFIEANQTKLDIEFTEEEKKLSFI